MIMGVKELCETTPLSKVSTKDDYLNRFIEVLTIIGKLYSKTFQSFYLYVGNEIIKLLNYNINNTKFKIELERIPDDELNEFKTIKWVDVL